MLKECKKHGLVEFKQRRDGRWRCGQCAIISVSNRRRKLKRLAIEYKGGKCELCGYNKCVDALDFHHTDPTKKDFAISSANKSWSVIKVELDKCTLICANCHRELHSGVSGAMVNASAC